MRIAQVFQVVKFCFTSVESGRNFVGVISGRKCSRNSASCKIIQTVCSVEIKSQVLSEFKSVNLVVFAVCLQNLLIEKKSVERLFSDFLRVGLR